MRILIVGAGSEIAENIVKYHVDNKDDVSIIDHPSNKNKLMIDTESVSKYFLDVNNYSEVNNFFDSLDKFFEKLYFLVGTNIFKDVFSVTNNDWDYVMDTNLKSFFFFSQFFAKKLIDSKKGGNIVCIGSQHGVVANGLRAPYCTSKGGLIHLTKVLALEYSIYNILVNCVSPTYMLTEKSKEFLNNSNVKKEFLTKIPLKKYVSPEEVADCCIFLNNSSSITGHNLIIDGGYSIW
ncbi:SDR family NAD(P)-dependent oxidoreductase [Mammaliicoccus sciuri]|uniref:SDR family NAD(P)-dependent oxidoreductase n=1 Tax=Mammaliicoccus sciuri TaxID=1296 RepID=UPI001EF507D4|nr:SDR family oxidoreductase [Mammaliicoccus sciuri]MEB5759840.1 SDR family oxidoreductase [Mammaliicoccus sciuri]CAG7915068.1 2-dehydro-3-deoxy-D-gluconate 5-dehydrogenase [Mammaliicoccus sciuri]